MKNLFGWCVNLLKGMGDALFHPYRDNQPPSIGYQPYTDREFRHKRASI